MNVLLVVSIMRFEYSNCILEIKKQVLDEFKRYIQTEPSKKESGGILIGRYIKDTPNAIVDICTIPQPEDQQKRYFFKRSKKYHQEILDLIWEKSNSTQNYLGEWHTHPESKPVPSSHDLREWRNLLNRQNEDVRYIFYVIVGIDEIFAWRGCTKCKQIVEMKVQ